MAQSKIIVAVLILVAVGAFVAVETADASAENATAVRLLSGCLHNCNKTCGATGKEDLACSARCDSNCHVTVEALFFYADVYAKAPPAEKMAVIQAIDKEASDPLSKVELNVAFCMSMCSTFCSQGMKDPACAAICDNGCHGSTVSRLLSSATPAKKEAISKDIEAAMVTARKA